MRAVIVSGEPDEWDFSCYAPCQGSLGVAKTAEAHHGNQS